MTDLKLNYHYGNEADQYSFYRILKILFTDDRFQNLSLDAKILYGLMLDRMGQSIKNGWFDDEKRVFIYFTLEDACGFMGQNHSKMVRIMAELDTKKGVGLIERKKQGQGKPTIIYVKNCCSLPFKMDTTAKTEPKKYPKPNFKTDPKTSEYDKSEQKNEAAIGENQPFSVDNPMENHSIADESLPFCCDEVQTSENEISSLHKKGSQDFLK